MTSFDPDFFEREEITAAAIREQMVDRGFTEDASSPLLINIAVTVHREVATAPAYGPGSPVGPVFGPWGGFYPSFIWPRPYYWNPDARPTVMERKPSA